MYSGRKKKRKEKSSQPGIGWASKRALSVTTRMLRGPTCVPLHVSGQQGDSPYPGVSPERIVAAEVHHGPVTGNTWTVSRLHRGAASGLNYRPWKASSHPGAPGRYPPVPIHNSPCPTAGLPTFRPGRLVKKPPPALLGTSS